MRTSTFLRTSTRLMAEPAFESAVTARTVARQVVSESGKVSETCACPVASVCTFGVQNAVSGKALRMRGLASLPGFTCASCGRYRALRIASIGDFVPASPLK